MQLIIDGYNVIGSERGLTGALEHKRQRLIQQLSVYRELKPFDIVLVFDGYRSGGAKETAQKLAGVNVVFSGAGEKADAVIVRLARAAGSGVIVVSSDREVANAVETFGAVAVSAGDFSEILRSAEAQAWSSAEEFPLDRRDGRKGEARRAPKAEKKRLAALKKLRP